jgi:predicted phage-related endonuclease
MSTQPRTILGDGDDAFRASVVGGSEVAALFGASPYLTEFELFHRKAGNIATPEFGGNERIEAGIRLEPVIIDWACDKWGYTKRETPRRVANGKGLGGHPDQLVTCPDRGPGLLEVKTADWLVAKKWGEEPPLHYQLQAMAYMGLTGSPWADLVILVGGNELRRFQMEFRPRLYAEIEARVVAFWQAIAAGDAPRPDFTRDGATLIEVLGEPTDEVVDLRDDNYAEELAIQFLAFKAAEKTAAQQAEACKNELLMKIGSAGRAMLPGHKVGCNQTKGSPGTLITEDMIGTTIGARKGWRRFDVKEL